MSDSRPPKTLTTTVLRVLLGLLVVTAVIAIVNVWTDVDPDAKVLLSTLTILAASLIGLAGAVRIDREARALGFATLVLASGAAFMSLWLIWVEPQDPDALLRLIASTWLWSLTLALHSLIGLAALPKRSNWLKIAVPLATYAGSVLATLVIFAAFEHEVWVLYCVETLYIAAGLAGLTALIVHLMHRQGMATGD